MAGEEKVGGLGAGQRTATHEKEEEESMGMSLKVNSKYCQATFCVPVVFDYRDVEMGNKVSTSRGISLGSFSKREQHPVVAKSTAL